ncbi:MAG: hypothetical protein ACREOO_32665 [bacterium]
MKCQACGHAVQRRAQFCHYCGKPVAPRIRNQESTVTRPRWPLLIAVIAGGMFLGAVAMQWMRPPEPSSHAHSHFDGTLRGEALAAQYPAVYRVAAEFICPCGTCTDGLEVCDCEMARGSSEVRAKIYDLLQVHEVPHTIALLEEEYGYRKNSSSASRPLPSPPSALPWAKPGQSNSK